MNAKHFIGLWSLLLWLGDASFSLAQIVPDTTLSSDSSQLQLQGNQITIEGGANRGVALFHSFDQFNVVDGQQVVFVNPQGIDTILSRVTGDTPSNLDGTLGVLGPADLFLLNPNGIFLGPNAQLDLSGNFIASTADGLQVGDISFSAIAPEPVPLLSINVLPGIQLGANAPERLIQNQADLTLAPKQQLTFDGGTIQQAGQITIPGGTVELRGSTISLTGEINTRTADNQLGLLQLSSPTDLTIAVTAPLTNQAINQALQNNEVVVESDRNLTLIGPIISNALAPLSLSSDNNLSLLDDGTGTVSTVSANVTLQSDNDIHITNPLFVSVAEGIPQFTIQAVGDIIFQPDRLPPGPSFGIIEFTGDGGRLLIQANSLTASEVGNVLTFSSGEQGPNIDITVNQDLILGASAIGTRAGFGQTAGNIQIQAGQSVKLLESTINSVPSMGAVVQTTGNIDIQVGDIILVQSGFLQTQSTGSAGNINLMARQILLDGTLGQSLLAADTQLFSMGDAGDITLSATDSVELIGDEPGPFIIFDPQQLGFSRVIELGFGETTIQATAFGSGLSGTIEVNADQLTIRDGALIANAASLFNNEGEPGDVTINVNDLYLSGFSILATGTVGSLDGGRLEINSDRIRLDDGAGIGVSSVFGTGNAGELIIRTNDLVVAGGSAIAANSLGGGSSGLLDIQAQSILVDGTSVDNSFSSSLLTDVSPTSTGPGGSLNIQTNTLEVLNGGQIRASTQGSENAGNLNIIADQVTVSGTSPNNAPSTIEAQSTGIGDAGNIHLEADQLTIRDQATISTQSLQGNGGDIFLGLDEVLLLRQQGTISATAGVIGTGGDGGNINIEAGFVVGPAAENSDITANAFLGSGGNVTISTNALLGIAFRDNLTPLSDITASSTMGLDGTVVIEQFVDEVESDPVQLPEELVRAEDRLTVGCLLDEDASFVVTGQGGIPLNSGELLNQTLIWTDLRETVSGNNETVNQRAMTDSEFSELTEAQGLQINDQGQVELVAIADIPMTLAKSTCYRISPSD